MMLYDWQKCTVVLAVFILAIIAGCTCEKEYPPFDAKGGFSSTDYHVADSALIPIEVPLKSEYDYFYISDRFVFIGEKEGRKYAVTLELNRGLDDNRFIRAVRDFTGNYFDGNKWVSLPYTRAKHNSNKLETLIAYYFGSVNFDSSRSAGVINYDRHGIKFEIRFHDLQPVQFFKQDESKQYIHACGDAELAVGADTINGTLFYELLQLEGCNLIVEKSTGIDPVRFDRIALITESGDRITVVSDSAMAHNQIIKNFLALSKDETLIYAEGSDYVQVRSSQIEQDKKTGEYIALQRSIIVPDLAIELELQLTPERFFASDCHDLALVEGELKIKGRSERVWGIIKHQQQSGLQPEQLK